MRLLHECDGGRSEDSTSSDSSRFPGQESEAATREYHDICATQRSSSANSAVEKERRGDWTLAPASWEDSDRRAGMDAAHRHFVIVGFGVSVAASGAAAWADT